MKAQNHDHLQEEQILWAVIDEKELGVDARQHLQQCPVCNKKLAQFRDELQEFGQAARLAVPPYSRQVELPGKKPAAAGHNIGWIPFFGATAMAGLLVFFYFMGMGTTPQADLSILQSQENLLEDEPFMREISEMVESPMSEEFYKITGENESGFDDDFFRFIVPDLQDDFQSELINQGGVTRC